MKEADSSGAGSDMLQGAPALGQQRETALAQAAHRAEQGVAGPGADVQILDPGGLLHRTWTP